MRKYLIYIIAILAGYLLVDQLGLQWDMTFDQRYTMSDVSTDLLDDLDEEIVITVFFEGDLPPSFRSYRNYIDYYLDELRRANGDIEVIYKDPTEGSAAERGEIAQYLKSYGVTPISRRVQKGESMSQNLIYPYISVHSRRRVVFVDLLEAKQPNQSESEALLSAQINLESKLMRAIRDVSGESSGLVAVVGDDHVLMANALNNEKGKLGSYFFFPMNAGQVLQQIDTIDAIIAIQRASDLDREILLAVDQSMIRGVPTLWLMDKYPVSLDSVGRYGTYTAIPREYSTEDLLFKHGLRISSDLVSSVDCASIPQVIGQQGGASQTEMIPYPYHPLLFARGDWLAPMSQPVLGGFVTSIDTLRTRGALRRQSILETSDYSRLSKSPVQLDFESLRYEIDEADYTAGAQTIGVAVEGETDSYFKNRLTSDDQQLMSQSGISYAERTADLREVVLSDADTWLPAVSSDGSLFPIGYSYWERRRYEGQSRFLANVMEYLVHGTEMVSLSRREITTPLIDRAKWDQGYTRYVLMISLVPIALSLGLMYLVRWYRRKRYAHEA